MQSQHPNPLENLIEVKDPSDGKVIEVLPAARQLEIDFAVSQASHAQDKWSRDIAPRREALHRCAKLLGTRRSSTSLAKLLTREQGKPFREALKEVFAAAYWFRKTADLELAPETIASETSEIELVRRPLGTVAAITPWNFPILLAASKTAPALLAGNAVILKPSPFTPLTTKAMCEILSQASHGREAPVPTGVFQVLVGDDETGRQLVRHPGIQKVSFTGSTEAGRDIAAAAGSDLKRLTLELGGNDAAIVLEDANLDVIAEPLFWAAFTNAGQFCVGIKRLYVHRSRSEALLQRLIQIAATVKVGPGHDAGVQIGPLANEPQYRRISELVNDAKHSGGVIECGGEPLGRAGYFFPPTIITNVHHGIRLVDEEQFGPVLPFMEFDDVNEVMERANQTRFGLGGSIWTSDLEQAKSLAQRMECGTCWINQHGELSPDVPFGGWKSSGIGCENGTWGLAEFTRIQVISRKTSDTP